MAGYRYSTIVGENMACAISHSLPVSTKSATQVCRRIKGMPVAMAKRALEETMSLKRAIPMKRYGKETAHKPGMASGRYPLKACSHVLTVLKSAEANAQFKGLSTGELVVRHAAAQQGPTVRGQGRTGGFARRTHVEIVLEARKK